MSAIEDEKPLAAPSVPAVSDKQRRQVGGVIFAGAVILALVVNGGRVDGRLALLVVVLVPVMGAAAFGLDRLRHRVARGTSLPRPSRRLWVGLIGVVLALYFLGPVPDVAMQSEIRALCRSAAYQLDSVDDVCRRDGTSRTDWHQPGDFVQRPQDYHVALRLANLPVRLFALDFTSASYRGFGICPNSPRDCR